MKTARRQSFVDFWERRGHFKWTAVINASSPAHIINVTFLQRTLVESIFTMQKCRPWVYLREIMESIGDRRFMRFEWYHLQTAASSLKWKQGGWNSFGHISVLLSILEQVQKHCYWTRVKMILHCYVISVLFYSNNVFRFHFEDIPTGLMASMFFILIAEWFLSNVCYVLYLALNFHQYRWKKAGLVSVWDDRWRVLRASLSDIVYCFWARLLWKHSSR